MKKLIESALIILLAILPLYIIRFWVGIPTTLLELFAVGFMAILVTDQLLVDRGNIVQTIKTYWHSLWQQKWFFILTGLFLLSATFSVFNADSLTKGLGVYKAYIIEPIALCILLQPAIVRYDLKRSLYVGCAVLSWWLFVLAFLQVSMRLFVFAPDELVFNRATGVYTTANALGLLLGPIAPLFGALVLTRQHQRAWLLSVAGLLCVTAVLLLSQSISALLGISFALVSTSLLYLGFQKVRWTALLVRLAVSGMVLVIVAQLIFFQGILPGLTPKVLGENLPADSFSIRLYMWQGAFTQLKTVPQGNGFSTFPIAYAPYRIYEDSERRLFADLPLYPHNALLNFWTEMGALGVFAYYGLLTWGLTKAIKYRHKALALGLVGVFAYIVVHGLTDVPYFKNDLAMFFWILVAFVVGLRTGAEKIR